MLLFVIDHLDSDADKVLVEKLYIEYMPWLRSRVYKHIKNIETCNDLSHDCMVSIIKHLDKVKTLPEEKVIAYFSVTINNLVINHLKKSSRQVANSMYDIGESYNLAADVNIEEEIERKYDYETIRAGFDILKERDKSIIIMKYDLELNDVQIADVLHIKPDCVRMTVLRSIRKLRKQIKKLEGIRAV